MTWWYLVVAAGVILLIFILWQRWELKQFAVSEYKISGKGITKPLKLVVLADLHGYCYGTRNERLVDAIREQKPDFILIAGDLIVSKDSASFEPALELLEQIVTLAPVYYAWGNHETRAARPGCSVKKSFDIYQEKVDQLGVIWVNNQQIPLPLKSDENSGQKTQILLAGLELPVYYFRKGGPIFLEQQEMKDLIGEKDPDLYTILLAHNPRFSLEYAEWGADLTFCGHNHGGLVQIPGIGSVISPQGELFPKYNSGLYDVQGHQVIVSRGLGTHSIHIRVFNRAQLVSVTLEPEKKAKNA